MKRLYDALKEYKEEGYYPAHMPGHKANITDGFLKEALRYDVTEVDGLDNLHDARGVILRSEEYAARLYGSEETHFLTGGSTSGIISAILGITRPSDRIIIGRNCHISVYNAVCEGRLNCSYIYPDMLENYGLVGQINPDAVEEAIKKDPDVKACVITSPTYEGVCSDIGSIADICHKYGKILITDAAHGAHFGFNSHFPASALKEGADIAIVSVHKTLPSPTQTALIHINGPYSDRERIRRKLKIYQSSSPSYLLMAGIDKCMTMIGDNKDRLFNGFYERLNKLEQSLEELKSLKHLNKKLMKNQGVYDYDPGKLVISTIGTGITGHELYDILRNEYRIQPEMASDSFCLMILTLMDTEEGFNRIVNALKCIDEKIYLKEKAGNAFVNDYFSINSLYTKRTVQVMNPHEAIDGRSRVVGIENADGKISADYVSLYPPGIPLLVPGEMITGELTEGIDKAVKQGLTILGLTEDKKIKIHG